jgi:opacity protein-like surface antigen
MPISRVFTLVACAVLAGPAIARAQQAPAVREARQLPVEVSPFVSTGKNDSTGAGVAVRWPFTARLGVEFEAEFRRTPPNPLWGNPQNNGVNGNVNLVAELPAIGRVRPYVIGGGGLEHYARIDQSTPFFPTERGMSFVVNAGGGVRVPINDRVGIRAEVRWSDGWMAGAPESFRMFYGATFGVGGR